jgi:hypothetical protein
MSFGGAWIISSARRAPALIADHYMDRRAFLQLKSPAQVRRIHAVGGCPARTGEVFSHRDTRHNLRLSSNANEKNDAKEVQAMKKINSSGLVTALAGLLIIGTPLILPVCQGLLELTNGRTVPMRCFWTARAEMLLGSLILLIGLMIALEASPLARRRLNHTIVLLGLGVVLTPLILIPTCANPDMACNVGTKPAWLLLGSATVLIGLWGSRAQKPGLLPATG